MIAVLAARLPPGFLALQGVNHPLPVEKCPWRQEVADPCQARLVIEQHLDRDSFFPALRKLRPVLRHGRIQIELAPRGQDMGAERGCSLGRGPYDANGILLPECICCWSSDPSPQINHWLALQRNADRRSYLIPLLEIFRK